MLLRLGINDGDGDELSSEEQELQVLIWEHIEEVTMLGPILKLNPGDGQFDSITSDLRFRL